MSGDSDSPVPLSYERSRPHQHLMRRVWWIVLILLLGLFGLISLLMLPAVAALWSDRLGPFSSGLTGFSPAFLLAMLLGTLGIESNEQPGYALYASVYLVLIFLLQWLFLVPRGSWRIRLTDEGRPMRRSAIAAAVIGMLLSAGLLSLVLDFPLSDRSATPWYGAGEAADKTNSTMTLVLTVVVILILLWLLWFVVFWAVTRHLDRRNALVRLYRALVAGTVLELIVAVPAHAYVGRNSNDDCYCTRGSYCAFITGLTAAIWLFGPGIYFVLIREKRRLERS